MVHVMVLCICYQFQHKITRLGGGRGMSQLVADTGALSLEERAARFYDLDEELLRDPWSLYRDLREQQPVMRVGPAVVVSRYADIKEIFKDLDGFSNRRYTGTRVTQRRASLGAGEVEKYDYLINLDVNHIGQ